MTGSNLHEPKGADSATAKKVYVADGAGSGSWVKLGPQSLSNLTTNGTAGQFIAVDGSGNFVFATAAHGSIYFYNIASPYTLTYPSVFTKVAPTTVANGLARDVVEGTNARLTYSNTGPAKLDIVFNLSIDQTSGAARDLEFALYKNGTTKINGSNMIVTTESGIKHAVSCHSDVALESGDYVEVWGKNNGGSGDVRVYTMSLFASTSGA